MSDTNTNVQDNKEAVTPIATEAPAAEEAKVEEKTA